MGVFKSDPPIPNSAKAKSQKLFHMSVMMDVSKTRMSRSWKRIRFHHQEMMLLWLPKGQDSGSTAVQSPDDLSRSSGLNDPPCKQRTAARVHHDVR